MGFAGRKHLRIDFSQRSALPEIIDDVRLDAGVMADVLRNLRTINRFLGGISTTVDALSRLLPPGDRPVRVLDVGAGGGDMARQLIAWGRARRRRVEVVSLDLSLAAAQFARDELAGCAESAVVQADVFALPFRDQCFDVAHCALFLHHFPQKVAARLLRALYAVSRHGVIVNDLHRHPLAWAGIWVLTRALGAHPVVQHDAALSVLRAFDRADLTDLSRTADLPMEVRWRWAFRYQIVIRRAAVDC